MVNLRGAECFVAVVDEGSVSAAARALHLSQPVVSHHLAALERELGLVVLRRGRDGTALTGAGREIEPFARRLLAAQRAFQASARAVASGEAGHLRIGCAESLTAPLVAPALEEWLGDRPGVRVSVVEETSADALIRGMVAGSISVAVCPAPTTGFGERRQVGEEEIVAVSRRVIGTAGRGARWDQLLATPVIRYTAGHGLSSWMTQRARDAGVVSLEVTTTARSAGSAARLASAGLGTAIVPRSAVPAGMAVIPLDPPVKREIFAFVAPLDPIAASFADVLERRGIPDGMAG